MVELVEVLGELVAVVGDASRVVVFASVLDGHLEGVHLLDELYLLVVERRVGGQGCGQLNAVGLGLAHH